MKNEKIKMPLSSQTAALTKHHKHYLGNQHVMKKTKMLYESIAEHH